MVRWYAINAENAVIRNYRVYGVFRVRSFRPGSCPPYARRRLWRWKSLWLSPAGAEAPEVPSKLSPRRAFDVLAVHPAQQPALLFVQVTTAGHLAARVAKV